MATAKVIVIDSEQTGGRTVELPEYEGFQLLILRTGFPLATSDFSLLPGGGFELDSQLPVLGLNERIAVFPLSPDAIAVSQQMAPLGQYPHVLIAATLEEEAELNGQGNWEQEDATLIQQYCRAEPNAKGGFVSASDGQQLVYDWLIYLPLPVTEIAPGTKVTIQWNGQVFGKGEVKRFSKGQLNARIWL